MLQAKVPRAPTDPMQQAKVPEYLMHQEKVPKDQMERTKVSEAPREPPQMPKDLMQQATLPKDPTQQAMVPEDLKHKRRCRRCDGTDAVGRSCAAGEDRVWRDWHGARATDMAGAKTVRDGSPERDPARPA